MPSSRSWASAALALALGIAVVALLWPALLWASEPPDAEDTYKRLL